MSEDRCAWCYAVVEGPEMATRADLVWHPKCFIAFLEHKDELAGIDRTGTKEGLHGCLPDG